MKCDICNSNEAVIFIQEVSGNSKRELHLCVECAKERGIPTNNIDPSLFSEKLPFEKILSAVSEVKKCSVCGRSLIDIKRYKTVGCPQCYIDFGPEILELLTSGGKSQSYEGTFPRHVSDGRSVLQDRIILQGKLEQSVASENFEEAAVYRDKLKALEESDE